eukprot:1141174-Pelagomonas_calceolata.AAC.4
MHHLAKGVLPAHTSAEVAVCPVCAHSPGPRPRRLSRSLPGRTQPLTCLTDIWWVLRVMCMGACRQCRFVCVCMCTQKVPLPQIAVHHAHVLLPLQARLLYHEAAVLEAQQLSSGASNNNNNNNNSSSAAGSSGSNPSSSKPSEPRLQLLKEALEYAKQATQLNPCSLSSAALRATLVVNVLVEESSLFSGSAASAISGIAGSSSNTSSAERIKQEFRDAMSACSRAANTTNPTMAEPVVNINDGGSQTCDPCSLVRPWQGAFVQLRSFAICNKQPALGLLRRLESRGHAWQ